MYVFGLSPFSWLGGVWPLLNGIYIFYIPFTSISSLPLVYPVSKRTECVFPPVNTSLLEYYCSNYLFIFLILGEISLNEYPFMTVSSYNILIDQLFRPWFFFDLPLKQGQWLTTLTSWHCWLGGCLWAGHNMAKPQCLTCSIWIVIYFGVEVPIKCRLVGDCSVNSG